MTDQDTGSPYIIFILVFCFFITGLLGFIICHMLKEKGYRCRTGEPEDENCKDTYEPEYDDHLTSLQGCDDPDDTVEQILKCIIANEANVDAFSEMLGNQNPSERQDLRLFCKESLQAIPSHHHTIHLGSDQNFCLHCGQGHSKRPQRRNQLVRIKSRPGEQTVLSVGRFRVTHMEKKDSPHDSTNLPIPESSEQSDHTEHLDCETGIKNTPKSMQDIYNIQNMFNSTEATNAAKQKKSVTLLGFHKDSDIVSSKEKGTGDNQHETSDQFTAFSAVHRLSSGSLN